MEKILKPGASTVLNSSLSSDDSDLLEWIVKKKEQKKASGEALPDGISPLQTLVRLLNITAVGGGVELVEDTSVQQISGTKSVVSQGARTTDTRDILPGKVRIANNENGLGDSPRAVVWQEALPNTGKPTDLAFSRTGTAPDMRLSNAAANLAFSRTGTAPDMWLSNAAANSAVNLSGSASIVQPSTAAAAADLDVNMAGFKPVEQSLPVSAPLMKPVVPPAVPLQSAFANINLSQEQVISGPLIPLQIPASHSNQMANFQRLADLMTPSTHSVVASQPMAMQTRIGQQQVVNQQAKRSPEQVSGVKSAMAAQKQPENILPRSGEPIMKNKPGTTPQLEVKNATNLPNKLQSLLSGAVSVKSDINPVQASQPVIAEVGASSKLVSSRRIMLKPEETVEVRPLLTAFNEPEVILPQRGETNAKNESGAMSGQQPKMQAGLLNKADKPEQGSGALEVDYVFQRWSGDHSVKVTVPTQTARETNITLLPSDTRMVEMLARHIGNLPGPIPDLLTPHQEQDEEQHQRQRQHPQEEDQE